MRWGDNTGNGIMWDVCQDQLLVGAGQEVEEGRKERREAVQELRATTSGGSELLSSGEAGRCMYKH